MKDLAIVIVFNDPKIILPQTVGFPILREEALDVLMCMYHLGFNAYIEVLDKHCSPAKEHWDWNRFFNYVKQVQGVTD